MSSPEVISSNKTSSAALDIVPPLFRLPAELRKHILLDVLYSSTETWVGAYVNPIWGVPLQNVTIIGTVNPPPAKHDHYMPAIILLLVCRLLHNNCLITIAENLQALVRIDVRSDAPSRSNSFPCIYALRPSFRDHIRHLVLHMSFIPLDPQPSFWCWSLNYWKDDLAFEKIIENINELLHLLPRVEDLYLVWDLYFGNGGIMLRQEAGARRICERVRKDWPGRKLKMRGWGCMGVFDEVKT